MLAQIVNALCNVTIEAISSDIFAKLAGLLPIRPKRCLAVRGVDGESTHFIC